MKSQERNAVYAVVVVGLLLFGVLAASGNLPLGAVIPPNSVPGVNFYVSTTESAVAYAHGGAAGNRVYGEIFTASSPFIGRQVDLISIPLIRPGTAIGIAEIGVFDQAGNQKYNFCDIPASAIATTKQEYTCFNDLTAYTLQAGDVVGIKYTVGDYPNRIGIYIDGANPEDGINSYRVRLDSTGNWGGSTSQDIVMILGLSSSSTPPPVGPPGTVTITSPTAGQAVSQHSVTVIGTTTVTAGKTIQTVAVHARTPDTSAGIPSYVTATSGDDWKNWAVTIDVTDPAFTRLLARITFTDGTHWHSPGVIVSYTVPIPPPVVIPPVDPPVIVPPITNFFMSGSFMLILIAAIAVTVVIGVVQYSGKHKRR